MRLCAVLAVPLVSLQFMLPNQMPNREAPPRGALRRLAKLAQSARGNNHTPTTNATPRVGGAIGYG